MSFGRHRVQPGLNGNHKQTVQKKEQTVLTIITDEKNEEAVITLNETEEKKPVKKNHKAIKVQKNEPIISDQVEKEEIKKIPKKIYEDNTGLVGKNTVCKEFRAIIKKKDLKINEVLNKILHEWNTANYNL